MFCPKHKLALVKYGGGAANRKLPNVNKTPLRKTLKNWGFSAICNERLTIVNKMWVKGKMVKCKR